MYTMDFRFRQGSVNGLQLHPDPDTLVPLPDLFPGKDVEYASFLDFGGNRPDHRENVAHRHTGREDASQVPENGRKFRERCVSTRGRRRSGRLCQADLPVEDWSREGVFLEQLLADGPEPGDDLAVPQDVRRLPYFEKRPEARGDDVDRGGAKMQQQRFHDTFHVEEVRGSIRPGPVARKPLPAEDHAEPGFLEVPFDIRYPERLSPFVQPDVVDETADIVRRIREETGQQMGAHHGRIVRNRVDEADRVRGVESEELPQPLPFTPTDE